MTFDDGGTLSGSLVIAVDGTPQNFDVTTSGCTAGTFGTNHYTGSPSPLSGDGPNTSGTSGRPNHVGEQYLNLLLPVTTSAVQGDTLPLATPNKSWECTNCSFIRYVNAGSIVAGGTVDLTAPDISFSIDPQNPDGNNGWYTGDPTVTFTVTDPDSNITNETGCDPQTLDEDNEDFEVTCEATSGGGTNSSTVILRRDATPPTLAPGVSPDARAAERADHRHPQRGRCDVRRCGPALHRLRPGRRLHGRGYLPGGGGIVVHQPHRLARWLT